MEQPEKGSRQPYYYAFHKDKKDDRKSILNWWEALKDNRGDRAHLRRCNSPLEVITQPGFHRLSKSLPYWTNQHLMGLATVAGLLSHLEQKTNSHLPTQLGSAKEGGKSPIYSELRFQQLLSSETADDLYRNLRRALTFLNGGTDPILLADGILHWHLERKTPERYAANRSWKFRWARAYYEEVFKYQKESKS
ncbi:MAG: type I-E CRISPR-associated protein Cse2/CasB [Desulfobacterales bacterium]|nr:type I-E CRISPR-associated protein Cse2/CasB [Desulfobacterales bacterium]